MSVWSTKSSGRAREFIVLQHKLKGVNYIINGIKFRDGYAVVEKNSKSYKMLMQIPVLKGAREFPLSFLKKLPFITRTSDIRTVYGAEVYEHFLKEFEKKVEQDKIQEQVQIKVEQETQHIDDKKCSHRLPSGELCKYDSIEDSPSGYCHKHFLDDPKFIELGIEIPKFMTKKERQAFKENVKEKLKQMKSNT